MDTNSQMCGRALKNVADAWDHTVFVAICTLVSEFGRDCVCPTNRPCCCTKQEPSGLDISNEWDQFKEICQSSRSTLRHCVLRDSLEPSHNFRASLGRNKKTVSAPHHRFGLHHSCRCCHSIQMGNLFLSAFRTLVFSKWIPFYTIFEKMLLCRLVAPQPSQEINSRRCRPEMQANVFL